MLGRYSAPAPWPPGSEPLSPAGAAGWEGGVSAGRVASSKKARAASIARPWSGVRVRVRVRGRVRVRVRVIG